MDGPVLSSGNRRPDNSTDDGRAEHWASAMPATATTMGGSLPADSQGTNQQGYSG